MVDRGVKVVEIHGVLADGAYDSMKLYRRLEAMDIEPVIKPRRSARTDRGPPSRRSAARMIRDYGYDVWRRIVGYGSRWMVETAVSSRCSEKKCYLGSLDG